VFSARVASAAMLATVALVFDVLPVAAAGHPGSKPGDITAVGSRVFFAATTAAHGRELWVSDGSKAGTYEVADINPAGDSDPRQLTAMGNRVFFFADDGSGWALWRSDGTAAGTRRLGGPSYGYGLTALNGRLLFVSGSKLWKSDGTKRGTRVIAKMDGDIAGPSAIAGGFYYFFATDSDYETWWLWRSNGTAAGTSMVTEIAQQLDEDGYLTDLYPSEMMPAGDLIYFLMEEPVVPGRGPADLWQSDGTAGGTHQVFDSSPRRIDVGYSLTSFGGELYFGAEDAVGDAIWKTDGTETGTIVVKRIRLAEQIWSPDAAMTAVGSHLFFFARDGTETALWRTKGTRRTTVQVYSIALPPECELLGNFRNPYCGLEATPAAVGTRLFFPARSKGNGYELWVSDGTTAGTRLIKNIVYGGASSKPSDLTAAGSLLFFSARDGNHGRELWVTDGTTRGTRLVKDINPG
jgi:ELWxxDGT repeat protein